MFTVHYVGIIKGFMQSFNALVIHIYVCCVIFSYLWWEKCSPLFTTVHHYFKCKCIDLHAPVFILIILACSRQQAMQEGMATAISVPMKVMDTASSCWVPLKELAALGNMQCKSDLQVCISFLQAMFNISFFIQKHRWTGNDWRDNCLVACMGVIHLRHIVYPSTHSCRTQLALAICLFSLQFFHFTKKRLSSMIFPK